MKPVKKIVAIGGGDFRNLETLLIEREIVSLTGKKHSQVLYVPTASGDSKEYWPIFQNIYGKKLGCTTNALWLLTEKPSEKEIKQKVFSSDIIWVGGGNTLRMMKIWRKRGFDKILRKAYERGIVLAGISAGSICWFDYGHSDSRRFSNPDNWKPIRVKGLGFIHATHCPHYHGEKREKNFGSLIASHSGVGIALDDNIALEVIDDTYRIISSKKRAKAYRVFKVHKQIVVDPIREEKALLPLSSLLKVSREEYESWKETLDIMSNPDEVKSIRRAVRQKKNGKGIPGKK